MKRDYVTLALGMALGAVATLAAFNVAHDIPATVERAGPALIGHGCEGAGGDLWASEESDFPTQCQTLEAWQ